MRHAPPQGRASWKIGLSTEAFWNRAQVHCGGGTVFGEIFFLYCAFVIIVCGVLAISLRNPIYCVLLVLLLFFHMAAVYLTLQAEFLWLPYRLSFTPEGHLGHVPLRALLVNLQQNACQP